MLKRLLVLFTFFGGCFAFLAFLYYAFFSRPNLEVLLENARNTVSTPGATPEQLLGALRDLDVVVEFSQDEHPESLKEGLRWRARAHRRTRSFQSAEDDLTRLASIAPDDRGATFDLVDTLVQAGTLLGDITYFERAVQKLEVWRETRPQDLQGMQALGRTQVDLAQRLVDENEEIVSSLIEGTTTFTLIQRLRDYTLRPPEDPELPALTSQMRTDILFVVEEKRAEIFERAERARHMLTSGIEHLYASFLRRPHQRMAPELLQALALIGRDEEILVLAPVLLHPEYPETLRLPEGHELLRRIVWAHAEALRDRGFLERARDALETYRATNPEVHVKPDMMTLLDLHLAIGDLAALENLVTILSEDPACVASGWWGTRGPFYSGAVHQLSGRTDEAIRDLETFVRLQRQRQRAELERLQTAHRMLASAYLAAGRLDDANRAFLALVNLAEDPAEMQFELAGLTLDEFHLPREAGRLLVGAVTRKPALTPRAKDLADRIARAMLQDIGISIENAVQQATPGAGGLRFDPVVEWLVGRQLVEAGDGRNAVRLMDSLLVRSPGFYPAVLTRAQALAKLGQRDRAISGYRSYLEIVPEDDGAWLELADLTGPGLRVRGVNFEEVRFRALRHSLEGAGALQLGVALIARDQLDRALRLVSPDRLEGEDSARARLVLARAARDLAPQIAMQMLAAIPATSTHASEALFERLRLAARVDSPESVERLALEVDANTVIDVTSLAETIETLVHFRQPRAAYALLRRAEPRDLGSTYFRLLGLVQIALGKRELGEASLDRALAFRDEDAMAAGLDLLVELSSQDRAGEIGTVAPLLSFIARDARNVSLRRSLALGLTLAGQSTQAIAIFDSLPQPTEVEERTDHDWTRDVILSLVPPDEEPEPTTEATSTTKPHKPREPDAPWLLGFTIDDRRALAEFLALSQARHRGVEAEEHIGTLLQRHPRSLPLRWWFVKSQLANGKYLEAARSEQVLLLENPEFEPALRLLESTLSRVGRRRQALAIRALRLLTAVRAETPDLALVSELGESLFDAGESVALTQALVALPQRLRDAPPLRLLGARLLNEAGDHRQALRALRPLWTNALTNPQTLDETVLAIGRQYLTALLATEGLDVPEVEQVVSALLPRAPDDPVVIAIDLARRVAALPFGSPERALVLEAGLEAQWASPHTLVATDRVAAQVLYATLERDVPDAFENILWIEMCKDPADLDAWLRRARFLERVGRDREAIDEYEKLHQLRVSPEATVGLIRLRIRYAKSRKETEPLLPLLDREIARRANAPEQNDLRALRIDLLRSLGRLDEAAAEIETTKSSRLTSPVLREATLRTWFESRAPRAFENAAPLVAKKLPPIRSVRLTELLRSLPR
ncbi:MAG: hypothetical protein H6834_16310 [Planctomycetes bacterium]|nr:hypothetical protein [Planctomycetota bacterium]